MTFINKDLEKYNQMSESFVEFVEEIYDRAETNSDNKAYLIEALPYLKSLLNSIQILRGQFFADSNLRPLSYNIQFLSSKEEYFLIRYEKLEKILNNSNGN